MFSTAVWGVKRPSMTILARILALFALASSVCMAQQLHTAKVLIFSKTAEFRHESIPAATDALVTAGDAHDIQFDPTEDSSAFSDENLAQYDAILFLMNTKEVLNSDQTGALGRYLAHGGNFIAIHSASDALLTTPIYEQAVGAYFDHHADLQNATVTVVDKNHPSTSSLPERWPVYDEIYFFKSNPRDLGATVLLSVDESTYTDQETDYIDVQGSPHPLSWSQERIAVDDDAPRIGRSWYTSLGHEVSIWSDETFMSHVMGGITWTLASGTTRAFDFEATVGNLPSGSPSGTANGRPTGSASITGGTAKPSASPPGDSSSSRAVVCGLALSVGAAVAFMAI